MYFNNRAPTYKPQFDDLVWSATNTQEYRGEVEQRCFTNLDPPQNLHIYPQIQHPPQIQHSHNYPQIQHPPQIQNNTYTGQHPVQLSQSGHYNQQKCTTQAPQQQQQHMRTDECALQ